MLNDLPALQKIEFGWIDKIEEQPNLQESLLNQGPCHLHLTPGQPHQIKVMARNSTTKYWYFTLIYFSDDLQIFTIPPEPVAPDGKPILFYGRTSSEYFFIRRDHTTAFSRLRLLVSEGYPYLNPINQKGIQHLPDQPLKRSFNNKPQSPLQAMGMGAWGFKDLDIHLNSSASVPSD